MALRSGDRSLAGNVLRREGDIYRIRHLVPGSYHVVFTVHGYESVSRELTIGDDLADTSLQVLLRRAEGTLTVRVVDPEGLPVADTSLNLMVVVRRQDASGRYTGASSSSIAHETSDEEGLAVFDRLATGSYRVHAGRATRAVDVPHEGTVVLEVPPAEVEPGALLLTLDRAKAYDARRDDLPLELEEDSIRVLAPSGRLSRRRLEVGENLVFAFKSGYPAAITAVEVPADLLARKGARRSDVHDEPLELIFGGGGAVHGSFEPTAGTRRADVELLVFPAELWTPARLVAGTHQWWSFGRLLAGGARTTEEGAFRIGPLPPGTWVVATRRGAVSEPFVIVADRDVGPVVVVR